MTDILLYYKTKSKESFVIANEYNIHDRIKFAENNEQFVEWNDNSKFNINLLLETNKKI